MAHAPHTPRLAPHPLIDAAGLAADLDGPRPPVLLDVRWTLAGSDRADYAAGHLPGAIFVDLDTELADPPGPGGRHPLPAPGVLESLLSRAGIDADTPVVVYGRADASVAARAWWLLRWAGLTEVRVLDGGFDAWRAAGLAVDRAEHRGPGGGTARVRAGGMPTVEADEVAAIAAGTGAVVVDVRAPERYRGEVEPIDPVPGHIPGAVNLPLAAIHRPDGRLLPPAELRAALDAVGARDGARIAASCGSGVNACALVLAAASVGRTVALYPGSYSGWCALGRPVVR